MITLRVTYLKGWDFDGILPNLTKENETVDENEDKKKVSEVNEESDDIYKEV